MTSRPRPVGASLLVLALAAALASGCGARFPRPTGSDLAQGAAAANGGLTGSAGAGAAVAGTAAAGGLPAGTALSGAGPVTPGAPGSAPAGSSPGPNSPPVSTGCCQRSGGSGPAAVPPGSHTGVTSNGIKLGYLIPKTGAAPTPPEVSDGINAYWKFLNSRGGIYGRSVTATIYDTTSTDSGARTAAQQAIDDGNFAVIALDRLGVQGTIAKYLDSRQIPNVEVQVPVGLPSSMSWTFGITIDHKVQGKLIADYMAHVLKVHRVGVVYETDSTLQPGVDAFTAECRADGLQVVHDQQINGMDNQFLSEAQKLASDKAEVVWLYMAPTPAANIARESQSDGYTPIWFANSISWNFNIGLSGGGSAMNNARGFSPWPALDDPRLKTYAGYEPSGTAAVQDLGIPGWGIGQVVANAMQQAGKDLGRNNFRAAMQVLHLTTTSPVDHTPLLWSPLSFAPGVRVGADEVITFRQKGSGQGADTQWGSEADYRAGY